MILRYIALLAMTVTGASIIALLFPVSVDAKRLDDVCRSVETIFARGSGNQLDSDEYKALRDQLSSRIPTERISHGIYDLGTEEYGGHQYQAIQVSDAPYGNAIGAKVSSGYANDYGKSVDSGVGELYSYLTQRYAKCKSSGTKYILGGYSQGAQVIGQTLPKIPIEIRDSIVFAAFFGDPKLHLPEGEGLLPPACRGKDLSAYRRIIASCHVDNGSLGARKPYLPDDMKSKAGLWCYAKDYVCGSSKNILSTDGHGEYKNPGRAIDQAALEIAQRLGKSLASGSSIDTKPSSTASGTPDVVYVIDTTASMGNRIHQTKEFVRRAATDIEALNGRVALVEYRDSGEAFTARVVSDFSSDLSVFQQKLDGLAVAGGGDEPEAVLHALMTAFNGLSWQDGASKAAIVLTDAGFHQPDMVDGTTMEDVARRSLEIDPVNVYPVVPWNREAQYQELAEQTSGQVILDDGDTVRALGKALAAIKNRPVGVLKNATYIADPGQEITFDASGSYVVDAEIVQYEWDFDGDGVFERTTDYPVVDYVYEDRFDGTMQVRLTASNDTIANVSAFVKVGTYDTPVMPSAPIDAKVDILSTEDTTSTVELSWSLPDSAMASRWLISVDGTALGYVDANRASVEISDIQRSEAVELSVVGITEGGDTGETARVIVPSVVAQDPPEQPGPSTQQPSVSLFDMLVRCIKAAFTKLLSWF